MTDYREILLTVVEKGLERYPNKDVLIYYKRGELHITYGFYIWNGFSHAKTTIGELLLEGFEKSDIKELRLNAERFLIIEEPFGLFEIKYGERE
jgi:hypothetical protein